MLFICCFDVAVQHLADVVLTLQSHITVCIIQATSKQHLPAIAKRHINNTKTTSKQQFGPIIRNLAYNCAHVTYNPTVAARNGVCNIETASKQRLPAIPKRRFINIFGSAPCLEERTYNAISRFLPTGRTIAVSKYLPKAVSWLWADSCRQPEK